MKPLLLLTFCAFSLISKAQKMGPDVPRHYHHPFNFYRDSSQKIVSLYENYQLQKPGVYHAVQDGMPCVVPSMAKTERMPNAWPHVTMPYRDGNMPNPALPKIK